MRVSELRLIPLGPDGSAVVYEGRTLAFLTRNMPVIDGRVDVRCTAQEWSVLKSHIADLLSGVYGKEADELTDVSRGTSINDEKELSIDHDQEGDS